MWLFTVHGFYSVVSHDVGHVLVRSRCRTHLQNLIDRYGPEEPDCWAIVVWPNTDCQYRMIVPQAQWADVVAQMVHAIDYTNFKAKVGHAGVYGRLLHEVWTVVDRAYQRRKRQQNTA